MYRTKIPIVPNTSIENIRLAFAFLIAPVSCPKIIFPFQQSVALYYYTTKEANFQQNFTKQGCPYGHPLFIH